MAALCLFMLIGGGLAWGSDAPGRRQGLFLAGKDGEPVPAPVRWGPRALMPEM